MSEYKRDVDVPELGFWERLDLPFARLAITLNTLFTTATAVFRGKASPKKFKHHVIAAAIRKYSERMSYRQQQNLEPPTGEVYRTVMRKRGLEPDIVPLPHNVEGYWLGNKNAKNVLVYYHGGGFAMAAIPPHFEFWLDVLEVLNGNGHDIAVFFPRYTITPRGRYPTQLRQAIEGLRYILNETGRSPSNVMIGGDSAGGNLAMATLLHLTHPHPEIEPLSLSESLAGAFGFAPWINFNRDWPSMEENLYKDIIPLSSLENWSTAYLNNGEGDSWSEPSRAPLEWWKDVKTERILILAGADEILLSPIEDFATKIKSVFPHTTYIVGIDESHDSYLYVDAGSKEGTQTGNELRQWIASRL